jgi:predicted alpha/beta hydrolase family esterase
MKNAIIIHGKPGKNEYYNPRFPSASNFHWFPWLQKQLLIHEISAQTPEMFRAWEPDYRIWSREMDRQDVGTETILVGHSCGAGFIVQWLSEHKDITVSKVILVAPWLGPIGNNETDDAPIGGFFDFTIDPGMAGRVTHGITVFNSDNDAESIHDAVRRIREATPSATYREFHNHGHFLGSDLGKDEFPELLEEILR